MKRPYTLGRRAESAAETRQKLVDATFALHVERGISATSLRDIAERANVSVGTAYHHFPTYLDAIRACGKHAAANSPLPSKSIFDGCDDLAERVHVLTRELCAWYDRHPWLERIRAERASYAPVEEAMTYFETEIEQLARVAAHCTPAEARIVAALADVSIHWRLQRAGIPAARIPGRIAEIILAWLNDKRRRS